MENTKAKAILSLSGYEFKIIELIKEQLKIIKLTQNWKMEMLLKYQLERLLTVI